MNARSLILRTAPARSAFSTADAGGAFIRIILKSYVAVAIFKNAGERNPED